MAPRLPSRVYAGLKLRGVKSLPNGRAQKPAASVSAAAPAWHVSRSTGRVDRALLLAKVEARVAQLKNMNDGDVFRDFDDALKARVAEKGFAWGKDPKSKIRTSADYVRDVVHGQGRELADSVGQIADQPEQLGYLLDDIAERGTPQALRDFATWLREAPVLSEFQRRLKARPQVFVALTGIE